MTQSKPLLLAVDDEPQVLQLMKRILEPAGYKMVTASDGSQALALVSENNPELVILDIKMPGKSGMEVLHELQPRCPDTGVIMVTAVGDITTAVDAMKRGAFDYLMKPFGHDELVICVQKALQKRTLLLQNRAYQETLARQLSALNKIFMSHLKLRNEVEEAYSRLGDGIAKLAEEIDALRKDVETYRARIGIPPGDRQAKPPLE